MKIQFRTKKLPDPISIREAASELYVNIRIKDASIKKTLHMLILKIKNFDNVRFVKVNGMPAVGEHSAAKIHVDQAFFYCVVYSSLL